MEIAKINKHLNPSIRKKTPCIKKYTGRDFIENWDLDSTLYH